MIKLNSEMRTGTHKSRSSLAGHVKSFRSHQRQITPPVMIADAKVMLATSPPITGRWFWTLQIHLLFFLISLFCEVPLWRWSHLESCWPSWCQQTLHAVHDSCQSVSSAASFDSWFIHTCYEHMTCIELSSTLPAADQMSHLSVLALLHAVFDSVWNLLDEDACEASDVIKFKLVANMILRSIN